MNFRRLGNSIFKNYFYDFLLFEGYFSHIRIINAYLSYHIDTIMATHSPIKQLYMQYIIF
ncbi:MAG TPA: hypothetical protein VJC01_03865, partial [Candidatus Paceibacterota bacterium]